MACFADINVSQGSVATYARLSGSFNIHLTTNLPRNFPVTIFFKSVQIWLSYGHESVTSLFRPILYIVCYFRIWWRSMSTQSEARDPGTWDSSAPQTVTYLRIYPLTGACFCVIWRHLSRANGDDVYSWRPITRSSAIAEGPRDASCQLKSCQLPRKSAETTYSTSPDQIDGMKLEI